MERCSPVEMRKNLETVDEFRKSGVDFVAIPVKNDDHKKELLIQCYKVFEDMIASEDGGNV